MMRPFVEIDTASKAECLWKAGIRHSNLSSPHKLADAADDLVRPTVTIYCWGGVEVWLLTLLQICNLNIAKHADWGRFWVAMVIGSDACVSGD